MVLVLAIALMVMISSSIAGVVSGISNDLRRCAIREYSLQAFYAAQAGIYDAISQFRANDSWTRITADDNKEMLPDISYKTGVDANFLLLDTVNWNLSDPINGSNILTGIRIRDITQTGTVTITSVKLDFYQFSATIDSFTLGTTTYTGPWNPGDTITVNFALPDNFVDTQWQFSAPIPNNAMILVTFTFVDNSTRIAYLKELGFIGNNQFSIVSTGKVTKDNITIQRTIRATYDVGAGEITSWTESANHI